MKEGRRFLIPAVLLVISGAAIGIRFSPFNGIHTMYHVSAERVKTHLMNGLVYERHLPLAGGGNLPDAPMEVYVLGGTQESLSGKVKTVGLLFARWRIRKILLLHRPGITEYNPPLGRNYSNDEWAASKLTEEGVPIGTLEFVSMPEAVFATFAEARRVSAIARAHRVKRLVLVTSMHHTERVWLSFSHFNADNSMELYLYGSDESVGIAELLREYLDFRLYRYFVLPIDRWRGNAGAHDSSKSPSPGRNRGIS